MATRIDTVNRDGRRIHIYDNGLERDATTGHIVTPSKEFQIKPENANTYQRRRAELRAATVAAAANAAVERDDYRRDYGDLAFVAAITEAQYIKATTPDDPKSTAAANFIFEQANISARQDIDGARQPAADTVQAMAGFLEQLRGLLDDMRQLQQPQAGDNVDGNYTYRKQ